MYRRILAPLDGSKLSECSLEHIKEIATGCHVSEVILLTVLDPAPPVNISFGSQGQIEAQVEEKEKAQKQTREKAELYLDKSKEKLKTQGVGAETVLIQAEENNSAAGIILNYANQNNIDLIIMSTHGRSGITRWAFGSVADRVVRHSRVPVLTIAPAGCRLENK